MKCSQYVTRAWIDANDACIPPRRAAESTQAQQTGPACMSMRRSKMQGLGMRMRAGISIFQFVASARCRWCSQFPAHGTCQRTAKATTCGGRKPPFPSEGLGYVMLDTPQMWASLCLRHPGRLLSHERGANSVSTFLR